MSDEQVREAERRWRASDSVEDESRYLLELVRSGMLSEAGLQLAAYCGHPAAVSLQPGQHQEMDCESWVVNLHQFGKPVWLRSLVIVSEILQESPQSFDRGPTKAEADLAQDLRSAILNCCAEGAGRSDVERARDIAFMLRDEMESPWMPGALLMEALHAIEGLDSMSKRPAWEGVPFTLAGAVFQWEDPCEMVAAALKVRLAAWSLGRGVGG